jgi:uncharacterized delta-60 repeat protein
VALQADGKIVAAGKTSVEARAAVVRTNADGTPDSGFGVNGVTTLEYGGTDSAQDVLIQPDGKIVTAGYGTALNSWVVTRLTPAGTPDPTFDGDGSAVLEFGGLDFAQEIALQGDGKLVIAGDAGGAGGGVAVARLNADGSPDTTFDGDGRRVLEPRSGDFAEGVLVQPDGKIVVTAEGQDNFLVTRLNPNGSSDTAFDDDGTASIDFGGLDLASAAALQANGKIVVVGTTGIAGAIARLQPGGAPDTTFRGTGKLTLSSGFQALEAVTVQANGRLLLAGTNAGNVAVARIEGDLPEAGGGPSGGDTGGGGGGQTVPRCAGKPATIVGSARADRLKGTRRADVIVALGGNDRIAAGRGNDLICAGAGNDSIDGGTGNDRLYGQDGKDKLAGGSGKDTLSGGGGKDRLAGGSGRDSCSGDSGKDSAACEREKSV